MNTVIQHRSIQTVARAAGVLYLVITVAAIFAHFYMPDMLIVPGDPAATAANITADANLFRLAGVGGELVVLLSEVILSVLLYVLLRPVNKTVALLAAVARLVMTAIHGINLVNYYFVLLLLGGADYLTVFDPQQLQALSMLFIEAHGYGFTIGIVFLTIHVFALGYLIFQSGYFPKVLGILFVLAGVGYTIDSLALLFTTGYTTTPTIIALVIAVSEIAFPLWLLIKGVNGDGWQRQSRGNRAVAAQAAVQTSPA